MTILHDASWIASTLERLCDEVAAAASGEGRLAVVGIRTRGAVLAERMTKMLHERGVETDLGSLDITLYRDDLSGGGGRKAIHASDVPFDLTGRCVLLVDDVLHTARTVRAALTELNDYGRARCIRLLVLVDREGREMPVAADFVGERADVPPESRVRLHLTEIDGTDEVITETARQ